MAIVTAEIRFAPQLAAWFTANPTLVLADGELAYCSDGANAGKYKLGDGTTQLSALTFYGGVSSSGLTIGTTTITSGTNTRILYNNAGVVGEYLVTGTGTTAVLSTSPTITTSLQLDGVLNIYDGGTKTINGGLISQINGAVLSLGANTGSSNLFGGTYTQAEMGGLFQIDTRSSSSNLFTWGSRTATTAAVGTTSIMTLTSTGVLTLLPTTTSHASFKSSAAGFMADFYSNSTHMAMEIYGDTTSHGSILRMYNKTTTNNIQLVGEGAAGLKNFFLTANTGFGTTTAAAMVEILKTTEQLRISYNASNYISTTVGSTGSVTLGLTGTTPEYYINTVGSTVIGNKAALNTTATDGFLYVPSCAGLPTGVPTAKTGKIAIVADSTNNKLYIYSGGAWVALN